MTHFVYPNANPISDKFIGCGRFIASEHKPDKYKRPSDIINQTKPEEAARILAYYESLNIGKKIIYEKKDIFAIYIGESMHLAYLLALISRTRNLRLKTDTDIWCTGSIAIIDGNPFLKPVVANGFDIKLKQGFLSEQNQDTLFIVPEGNFLPTHQELCDQKNVRVFSVEQFREQYAGYDFIRKTVLKVRSDELFDLTSLVFEMSQNPYKGLEAFEEEDAGRFFGRDEVIQELSDIYQNTCKFPIRLMAILGPSGSGKSSIARAGFIPKIRSVDSSIVLFRPGEHPLETLNKKLSEIPDFASPVIIADQFEETYSLCKDKQERTGFINTLMAQASASASVIIVLRTDFLGQTQGYPEFNYAITRNKIIVSAMQPYNLRAVIAEPARRAGYLFDVKIVDELISQTKGHDGALPLLEFALSAIWQGMEKGVSPEKTLKAINGVGGALAKKAKELYDSLSSEQDKRIIRRTFLRLINIGEGMFDTRRRVPLSELVAKDEDIAYVRKVLGIFSAPGARLITLSADSESNEIVEITHEALFEHWEDLKIWIDENRDDIRFHRRLSEDVTHWDNNNKPEGLLWRSPDLDLLKDYYKRNADEMTELRMAFYQASVQAEIKMNQERERAIQQKELAMEALKSLTYEFVDELAKLPGTQPILEKILKSNKCLLEKNYALYPDTPEAQRENAVNLRRMGDNYLLIGDTNAALKAYQESNQISARLIVDKPDYTEAQRDLAITFDCLGEISLLLGKTDAALNAYQQGLEISKRIAADDPKDFWAQRGLAISFERLGYIYLYVIGKTDAALNAYQQGLEISKKIVADDPENLRAQRDLAISFLQMGNIHRELGATDAALNAYQQALKIRKKLTEDDPKNTQAQRDLAISFGEMGDIYRKLESTNAALNAYQQALEIHRKLAEDDPKNTQAQRDLAISFRAVGNILLQLCNTNAALNAYRQALEIRKKLAEDDPKNTQAQRDLADSFGEMGDIYRKLDATETALNAYQQALEINRKLAEDDPKNTQAQMDLALIFNIRGDTLLKLGSTDAALNAYQQSLEIGRKLPKNRQNQEYLALSFGRMGDIYETIGDTNDALIYYLLSLEIFKKLAVDDPKNYQTQRSLMLSYWTIGYVQQKKMKNSRDALAYYQQSLTLAKTLAAQDKLNKQAKDDLAKLKRIVNKLKSES